MEYNQICTKIFAVQFITQKLGCRNKFHVTPISGLFNPYRYEIICLNLNLRQLENGKKSYKLVNAGN